MAKKGSSRQWMHEHLNDEYVKKAQKEGYRSRAVYKLIEIIDKKQIINNKMCCRQPESLEGTADVFFFFQIGDSSSELIKNLQLECLVALSQSKACY